MECHADFSGYRPQARQEFLQRLRLVEARHVHADTESNSRPAVRVMDRYREAAHPQFELLLYETPALAARLRYFVDDPADLGLRVARELRKLRPGKSLFHFCVRQVGQHDATH